ncbi:alpha-1,2-fucosyltransferase [Priestia flexa]|uniref:Alpha-1,2-fucosyltransferase n=1 Tax=Priestia flexa TaxID=86664 RepID=A0A8I1SM39_9BACI|nr:alpha-1,2-fucosyltransferase [Priestia flexa]MBN8250834.1 alpha-1,2-fucosyltransferase [Priestia flexa]
MMIVRVSGGLGNQMFQYAFYKYLQKKGYDVRIDINDYSYIEYHNGFELERVFNIQPRYANLNQVKKLAYFKQSLFCKIYRKIFKTELRKKTEITFYNSLQDEKYDKPVYFDGIWQDPTLAASIEKELKKDFQFSTTNINNLCLDMKHQITNCNSVSVHVRRGDYLKNKKFGEICNKEYYVNSMNYIKEKYHNPSFFIFSDDIEWCKENLSFISNDIRYINFNNGKNSYLDMYLMSLCNHNIIANSTFSWWGAWLNSNADKQVICPQRWDTTERDLSLDSWIKI